MAAWKQAHNALTITVNQLPAEGEPLPGPVLLLQPQAVRLLEARPPLCPGGQGSYLNLCESEGEGQWVVNIAPLLRPGFKYADNAALLLLTLLDGAARRLWDWRPGRLRRGQKELYHPGHGTPL